MHTGACSSTVALPEGDAACSAGPHLVYDDDIHSKVLRLVLHSQDGAVRQAAARQLRHGPRQQHTVGLHLILLQALTCTGSEVMARNILARGGGALAWGSGRTQWTAYHWVVVKCMGPGPGPGSPCAGCPNTQACLSPGP